MKLNRQFFIFNASLSSSGMLFTLARSLSNIMCVNVCERRGNKIPLARKMPHLHKSSYLSFISDEVMGSGRQALAL